LLEVTASPFQSHRTYNVIPARFKRESKFMDPPPKARLAKGGRRIFGEERQVIPEKCSAHWARALKHSGMTLRVKLVRRRQHPPESIRIAATN